MRNVFAGLMAVGLLCGVTVAQNPQRDTPATQPGAAGQKQGSQAGVTSGQTLQAQPGQPRVGQQGQPVQPGQQFGQQIQPGQPGRQGQSSSSDQEIAACIYGEAHNEIEIAKLAESKAQTEEARNFAQQMVRDHSPGHDEMKQLAGQLAADATPQRGGEQAGRGQLDWVSVKKEIGQQCLASTKKELSAKQGVDFDQCFMGQQVMAHMKVVDELTVLRNYASSELRQKLDKELQMAQHHLQLAKDIAHKLKDRPSERVSRKPESNQ